MSKKRDKIKNRYKNSKLHFIVFQTSKNPVNISVSKWFVYCGIGILFTAVVLIAILSYRTYTLNEQLNYSLSTLENQVQQLQLDKIKLNVENLTLKDSLDDKTVKMADALTELENLRGTIDEIKQIVGLPSKEDEQLKAPAISSNSRGFVLPFRTSNTYVLEQSFTHAVDDFDEIKDMLMDTKAELEELQANAEDRKRYLEDAPVRFPTNGKISSEFGFRWGSLHRGIDISNSLGTKIYAAGNGVVIDSKRGSSYGNYILIQHPNGFKTRYAHLSKRLVSAGDEIKQGDLIGLMGNTGTSYGSHLHYEIYYNNNLIDPLSIGDYLKYKE